MVCKDCAIKERQGGVHVANYVFECTREDGSKSELRARGQTTDREKALKMCRDGAFG